MDTSMCCLGGHQGVGFSPWLLLPQPSLMMRPLRKCLERAREAYDETNMPLASACQTTPQNTHPWNVYVYINTRLVFHMKRNTLSPQTPYLRLLLLPLEWQSGSYPVRGVERQGEMIDTSYVWKSLFVFCRWMGSLLPPSQTSTHDTSPHSLPDSDLAFSALSKGGIFHMQLWQKLKVMSSSVQREVADHKPLRRAD